MHIDKQYFDGKKVVIFGLGVNGGGLGTLDFLLSTDVAHITVTDRKSLADFQTASVALPADNRITWRLGEHHEADFHEADIIVKNPSIPWSHPLLVAAQGHGTEVVMDSTIFMALCPAPVIGVTGSKGKTTTASLIAHILESAGHHVVRVGISQTGVLSELAHVTPDSVVVFELSSWRLSGLKSITKSPHISVITNLYPDHLNYYADMESYAEDKKIITAFQSQEDTLIISRENEWTPYFTEGIRAQVLTFGLDAKAHAWQDETALWIQENNDAVCLLQKTESLISGEHFFANMLAASLAAFQYGVSKADIQNALKTFTGVPHRFQLVRSIHGVRYINDTAATIPSAALASVEAVTTPCIILAGGSDKKLPLNDLLVAIAKSRYAILFAGDGTEKILAQLSPELREKVAVAESMQEAVQEASQKAEAGDTVLLAPGAASFGMFTNEFDRGEQFIKAVNAL